MEESFLLPVLDDPDTAPFWEGAARGELLVQHCGNCGVARMPPRPMCPHCRSMETVWEPVSGRGTVWSYVIPHPPLLPAYTEFAPYNVIVVALEENPGLRLVGNLVDGPDGTPLLLELELVEPSLFLPYDTGAAARFVTAALTAAGG